MPWINLPVDVDSGEKPPRLDEGETYTVRLPSGEEREAEWAISHGCRGFELDGEPVDVAAVYIGRSYSGPTVPEAKRAERGQCRVGLRLDAATDAVLREQAADVGATISDYVTELVWRASGRRRAG
jgi:hypothetical protein